MDDHEINIDMHDELMRFVSQSKALVVVLLTASEAHTNIPNFALSDSLWLLSDRIADMETCISNSRKI